MPGFDYQITFTAKRNSTTSDFFLKAAVIENLSQYNTAGQATCTKDANVPNYTLTGIGQLSEKVTTTSANYVMKKFSVTTGNYKYLIVWAQGGNINLSLDVLNISKIKIEKTPPATTTPTFTLPGSTNVTCGSTSPVTFTITNVNNTQGVTGYTWNLGSASNGWVYNGSSAPQTVSTATNTLTLTPVCGASLSSVSATVTVGSSNYNTNSSTINLVTPSLGISGSNTVCGNRETYSIPNLPCNSTVSWGPITPSGVVASEIIGNDIRLTRIGNGTITLTATINSACAIPTLSKTVNVQTTPGTVTATLVMSGTRPGEKFAEYQIAPFTPGSTIIVTPQVQDGTVYAITGNKVEVSFPCFSYPGTFTGTVRVQNACGISTGSAVIDEYFTPCGGGGGRDSRISVSPNPAKSTVIVSLEEPQKPNAQGVKWVQIVSRSGHIVKEIKYSGANRQITLDVSNLSQDLYILHVSNGTEWMTKQLSVEK